MPHFHLTVSDHIAQLRFDRPQQANSLSLEAWEEMRTHFAALDQDVRVRAIVLSGEGKHFCAGMDLQTLLTLQQNGPQDEAGRRKALKDFILNIQDCISSIERCRKPVIAAVHGGAIGGGTAIATACDLRYCSADAYFTVKEVDLGIVADIGTLQRLPYIVQPGIAAELAYTGRKVSGAEAAQIGLVNQCFAGKEELVEKAIALATQIAEKSPLVTRGIKRSLLYQRGRGVEAGLEDIAEYNSHHLISEDLMEAMLAYMQKRKPVFKDA